MMGLIAITVAFYFVVQFFYFAIETFDSTIYLEVKHGDLNKENDEGLIYIPKRSLLTKALLPVLPIIIATSEKECVKKQAEENADNNDYRNLFAKDSIRKLYDETFINKRKQIVVKTAKVDTVRGWQSRFSTPFEQALYQKVYLKTVTGRINSKNIVQERYEELYGEDKVKPVSDKVFKKLIEAS